MLSEPTPRVIFHIGQHKTGSKALQSYLSINKENLLKHNIYYPEGSSLKSLDVVYRQSHFLLYVLSKFQCLNEFSSSNESKGFWKEHKKFCDHDSVLSFFENIENRRKTHKANTIIFSAEDLFDLQTAHELSFNHRFVTYTSDLLVQSARIVGWDPHLVVYLRRPDDLLNAHYAQFIKGSDLNHLSFDVFHNAFLPRLDALNILKAWESKFSTEKMFVRPYEKNSIKADIVLDFFKNILGFLPNEHWLTPNKNLEFINKTPAQIYIDLIRECNLAKSAGIKTISRKSILEAAFKDKETNSSLNWMGSKARQELLNKYKSSFRLIAARYNGVEDEDFFKQGWIVDTLCNAQLQNNTSAVKLSLVSVKPKRFANIYSWIKKLISTFS